ncbi:MAG: hypothetical protein FWF08_03550, partial [Oscillospiraceae bacterium]|nr:hypothetical protein [Oscillospiraceae bacterium]
MKSVKPAPKSTSSVDVGGSLDYAMRGIRHVIDTFGKRDPGSEGEIKAQEYFAGELKQWADEVVTQKFDLHPNSFMGWMPIASSFGIISVLLPVFSQNIASKTICFALVSLALFLFIMQLLRYVHVTAFLFPKKTSANVYAS